MRQASKWSVLAFILMIGGTLMAADLEITASAPDKEVAVGDMIPVTVTVLNKHDKPTTVKELRFGRGGLAFKVTVDAAGEEQDDVEFTYTVIPGEATAPTPIQNVTIEGSKSISTVVKVPALLPGKMTLVPMLWSRVQLDTLTIPVKGEGKRIGLTMKTDEGEMTIALWPEVAPNTAANIARLSANGFYDGLTFHRIIKGFMIQGGDPDGNGTGGPGFSLPAEFNKRKHVKGVLSMARSGHPDSAGSQFFLMHGTSSHLDGKYTGFGKVIKGLEVVDKLANLPTKMGPGGENSTPETPPVIKKVTVTAVTESE